MTGMGKFPQHAKKRVADKAIRARVGVSSGAHFVVSLLVALAVLLSAMLSPSAAHLGFDNDAPAIQTAADVSAKSPATPDAPVKSRVLSLCTGHCTAHTLTLPASSPAMFVLYVLRASWWATNDSVAQASRPALLERPPRV